MSELERFDFSSDGEQLLGSASFGQIPRQIVAGKRSKDRLSFSTNLDGKIFQYRGELGAEQIQFTLNSDGELPTSFVAARTIEAARRLRPRLPTGGTEPRLVSIVGGPYELEHIRTIVSQLHLDIRRCYVANEYAPVDHVNLFYFLKIAHDGTLLETGAPGTDQRSVELDRCMDAVFRKVNWGVPSAAGDAEIRLGFEALPAWRSQ